MEGLEDARRRLARGGDAVARGRGSGLGRLVAERLQEPAHAVLALGGTEEDGHEPVLLHGAREVLVDLGLVGDRVLEELLQERVVEIGECLEELLAALLLALLLVLRQGDQVRGAAGLVFVGALAHQIDVAGDGLPAVADGHLAQHERAGGDGLERFQHVAHAARRRVHLVDEHHVGDAVVVEELEERG